MGNACKAASTWPCPRVYQIRFLYSVPIQSVLFVPFMQKILLLAACFLLCLFVAAQKKNAAFVYAIRPTASPVHIDGMADEEAWKKAVVAKDFFMVLPMDTSRAAVKTEVSMTYDNTNIYLLAICYNALPGPYMVES